MYATSSVLIFILTFTSILHGSFAVQKIKFVDDLCFLKKAITIDLRNEITGILMSVPRHTRGDSLNCRIRLLAERESSVVLSIYRYDIPSNDQVTIQDSDKHKIALIGSALFNDEKKSIISKGEMVVQYTRSNSSLTSGFQFTYTQVHESPCLENEFSCKNGRCIARELACNGHNHCGDNSDNLKCTPGISDTYYKHENTSNYSSMWIIALTVVAFLLLILSITLIIVVLRSTRKLKSKTSEESPESSTNVPIPLQSVSSSEHPIENQSPSVDEFQRSVQPPSLLNRIRRSLRGPDRVKVEEIETNTSVYQVPSMYPSLDLTPSAPELNGADNAAYSTVE